MIIMASGMKHGPMMKNGNVVQPGGHTLAGANKLAEACSLSFAVYIFDTGHPCYGQLTCFISWLVDTPYQGKC